jgi:hypothetical protein
MGHEYVQAKATGCLGREMIATAQAAQEAGAGRAVAYRFLIPSNKEEVCLTQCESNLLMSYSTGF